MKYRRRKMRRLPLPLMLGHPRPIAPRAGRGPESRANSSSARPKCHTPGPTHRTALPTTHPASGPLRGPAQWRARAVLSGTSTPRPPARIRFALRPTTTTSAAVFVAQRRSGFQRWREARSFQNHPHFLQPSKIHGGFDVDVLIHAGLLVELRAHDGPNENTLGENAAEAGGNHRLAGLDLRIVVYVGHHAAWGKAERGIDASGDAGLTRVLQKGADFAVRIREQEYAAFALGDGDSLADEAVGVEYGEVLAETIVAPAVNLDALPPVGRIATDDTPGDRVEGDILFQAEKLVQTQILVSHFAQGVHLLA